MSRPLRKKRVSFFGFPAPYMLKLHYFNIIYIMDVIGIYVSNAVNFYPIHTIKLFWERYVFNDHK